MKAPPLPILAAITIVLVGAFGVAALEAASLPLLLPVGMAGLGTLTLASERWRHPVDDSDGAAPGGAHEGSARSRSDAHSRSRTAAPPA